MTLALQTFGLGLVVDGVIDGAIYDGIVGLGYPSLAQVNANPITQALVASTQMAAPIFGVWLGSNTTGEVAFGGIDPNHFRGALKYYQVTQQAWWTLALAGVRYGNLFDRTGKSVILDTGTSLIGGPTPSLLAINRLIGAISAGDGIYTVACSSVSSLPNITFELGKDRYPLTPAQYILTLGSTCYSGFFAIDFQDASGQFIWILGDVFLRPYYSVYDFSDNTVGLATSQ